MNCRGIYSMLSAFFLAVVLVFVALALVYLNLLVIAQESEVFRGVQPFELAFDVKNKVIEECFDGEITANELEGDLTACGEKITELSQGQVAGFSIERMQHLACTEIKSQAGETENCTQRFVFFTNVKEDYKNCLGKIVICMGVKK